MDFSEVNAALNGMDPAEVALGAGIVGAIGMLFAIGALVWFFLSAIGYFKMFKKAGQRGWFAFIPFLREYAMFKLSWSVKAFVISTVLLAVTQIGGNGEGFLAGLAAVCCGIAWIVMQVKLVVRVVKAFGKGGIWALLLFFVPFITTMILGFGKAEYLGVPEGKKGKEKNEPSEV